MTFLVKLWIFNIDFGTIVSFLFGILIGMILMCLIYVILVLISLKDKKYAVKVQANDLHAKEAEEMIRIAQDTFKDRDLRGDLTDTQHLKNVCYDLVYGIASRFYPDSKHPLFELTVDECLELIGYVQARLDEILNKKLIKMLKIRGFRVSTIYDMTRTTTAVADSKAFEVTKEVSKAVSIAKKVVNVINPVWWFKKLTTDITIKIALKKIYVITIAVLGEEAYKIYSKSFNEEPEDIESSVDGLLEELDSELKDEIRKAKNETPEAKDEKKPEGGSSFGRMKQKYYTGEGVYESYSPIYDRSRRMKKKNEPACEIVPVETGIVTRED